MIGKHPAQSKISVGDRDLVPFSVARRARIRPGRLGAHRQCATAVHPGDGAAASADGVYLNHRHTDGVSTNLGTRGFFYPRRTQGNIGGRATHIQCDNVRIASLNTGVERPHHPSGGTAEDGAHWLVRR